MKAPPLEEGRDWMFSDGKLSIGADWLVENLGSTVGNSVALDLTFTVGNPVQISVSVGVRWKGILQRLKVEGLS